MMRRGFPEAHICACPDVPALPLWYGLERSVAHRSTEQTVGGSATRDGANTAAGLVRLPAEPRRGSADRTGKVNYYLDEVIPTR